MTTILIGRFLCGHVCASALTNIPAYTSEICQPEVRKITGSLVRFDECHLIYTSNQLLALKIMQHPYDLYKPKISKVLFKVMTTFTIGFSLMLVLGGLMYWRWACLLVASFPALTLLMTLIIPESPIWLMLKDQDQRATEALVRLR